MNSQEFQQLLKDRQTGERVRVLFDLLMETIKMSGSTSTNFWEAMKSAIDAEEKAVQKMWASPVGDEAMKVVRKSRKKKEGVQTQLEEPPEPVGPLFGEHDKEYGVNGDPNIKPPY